MPKLLRVASFGFEPTSLDDERQNAIDTYRLSERRMRAVGRFEAAVRYQNTADAIERGYVTADNYTLLVLFLTSSGVGVES